MKKLTVEQYEYLVQKVNELVHLIDVCKVELKYDPAAIDKIQQMEKTLMQLEQRMENSVARH